MNDEINYAEEIIEEPGMSGAKIGLLALGGLAVAGAIGGVLKKVRAKKLADEVVTVDDISAGTATEEN